MLKSSYYYNDFFILYVLIIIKMNLQLCAKLLKVKINSMWLIQ